MHLTMKKITILMLLVSFKLLSQVGINTASPNAMLEVVASDSNNPSNTDGILIPRITIFPATNPTVNQDGMLVYLTTSVGVNEPGFYYWDNPTTTWISLQKTSEKSKLIDTDSDTKVEVEANADEDIIRITTAGTEYFTMKEGRINVLNTGNSTFLGENAGLNDDLTANNNTAIGYDALNSNISGAKNTSVGYYALKNTTASDNSALGYNALNSNTTGFANSSVGSNAAAANISGSYNVALGVTALQLNTAGSLNTAIGYQALSKTTGGQSTAVGAYALRVNTTGGANTAIGYDALSKNTTGSANNAFGFQALNYNLTGTRNLAIGQRTLYSNSTGSFNIGIGHYALYRSTGNYNIALGTDAGQNTTGSSNVFIGSSSALNNISGSNNVYVGFTSGYNSTGSNNVFIGRASGQNETGSNLLYIDNSNTASPLIYGDFSSNLLRINGTLNINNSYSFPSVDGSNTYILQTDGSGTTNWVDPTSLSITELDPKINTSTANKISKWDGTTVVDSNVFDDGTNVGVATATPLSNFETAGSVGANVSIINTSAILNNENYVFFTGASGETITFPTANTCKGRIYIIVNHGTDIVNTSNYITGNSTTNNSISMDETLHVISDGTDWRKF